MSRKEETVPSGGIPEDAGLPEGEAMEGGAGKKGKPQKEHNKVYRAFDRFFGLSERGTNIKTEIFAGILIFVEIAFFLLINATILADTFASATSLEYSTFYFIMTLTACISTILTGVLCNAPLTQAGSLGLTVLMVSMYGSFTGLTYANVMAIALVAEIVYFIVMVIKPARQFLFDAIPEQIRKALPAAMGMFMIVFVLVQLGVFSITTYDYSGSEGYYADYVGETLGFFGISHITYSWEGLNYENFFAVMPVISGIIGFVLMLVLKACKVKHATIISLAGTVVVYLAMWYFIRARAIALTDYKLYSFIVPSYGGMYYYAGLGQITRRLDASFIWACFKQGFDFSAYTAAGGTGVAGLFIGSVVSFLILGVSETGAAVTSCAYITNSTDEKGSATYIGQPLYGKKTAAYMNVYSVSAFCSVLGCCLGAGPVVVKAENAVGASEGGKTGLTAIVTGLLLLAACFTLTFAGVFMNGNMVYGLMVFVGLELLTSLKNCDFHDVVSIIPFMLTILIVAFTLNFAIAIEVGIITHTLLKVITRKFREISVGTWVLTGLMVIIMVLQLCL